MNSVINLSTIETLGRRITPGRFGPTRAPGTERVPGSLKPEEVVMTITTLRNDETCLFRPSRSCAYEGWTVSELKKRAKQLGISCYSGLNKEHLISLIRSY